MTCNDPALLDDIRAWFARFVLTTTPEDLDVLALWTLHTWAIEQSWTTPRLLITAPLPASGKTTVLDHLSRLCKAPRMMANAPTKALSARLAHGSTLLLDESDKWGNGEDVRALFGIVNSGYKRGGTYVVLEPDETGKYVPTDFPVFGAVAFAGISPNLPDDTLTRSLTVHLLPDVNGVAEESDWEAGIEAEARSLRARIEAWAREAQLSQTEVLPDGVTGRLREVWRPLQRVADQIGGDWPERCRALAERHRDNLAALLDDGVRNERPHMNLMRDLFGVWPAEDGAHRGFVQAEVLVELLRKHSPESWGSAQRDRDPLTIQRMGRMLATNFNITTDRVRRNGTQERGYYEHRFQPAWRAMGLLHDDMVGPGDGALHVA